MGVTALAFDNSLNHNIDVMSGIWGGIGLVNSWLLGGGGLILAQVSLSQWQFNPETYQLQLTTENRVSSENIFQLQNPTRLVIDLPNTTFDQPTVYKNYSGLVKEIRIAQFQPKITRIVLELSPEARLMSEGVTVEPIETEKGKQWQITPKIEPIQFSLPTLLQLPPVETSSRVSSQSVTVPPPPIPKSSEPTPTAWSLKSGTKFSLRYRGENPLNLEVEQPWQEILFLEENLTDETGKLIAPAKTPVIGHFETTDQGARFVTQALITTLSSDSPPVIPLEASSSVFNNSVSSPNDSKITVPPDTLFTIELTEEWQYPKP